MSEPVNPITLRPESIIIPITMDQNLPQGINHVPVVHIPTNYVNTMNRYGHSCTSVQTKCLFGFYGIIYLFFFTSMELNNLPSETKAYLSFFGVVSFLGIFGYLCYILPGRGRD